MPRVNPQILRWARETAGLAPDDAVQKLDINDARGVSAVDRLAAYEAGEREPSRPLLLRMAKHYRRPLLVFYLKEAPRRGDRGEDFRTLPPDQKRPADALVDALTRDVKARQSMVKALLVDEEDAEPLPFIGSMQIDQGVNAVLGSIVRTIGIDVAEFRAQASPEGAFALLRSRAENAGIFVLLIGNLGSYQTTLDVETFRGFAIADPIAPFVVINDQDAKSAWSFTLLHELAHLWLGATGVSGFYSDGAIERFCNDVAGTYLLPNAEIEQLSVNHDTDMETLSRVISDFAEERHLSRSMVAYRLLRVGKLTNETWRLLTHRFRQQWRERRDAQRERDRQTDGGPNYYVVRRHRLGSALLKLVNRNLSEGLLTPTKASKVLGVKPRSVQPLLSGASFTPGKAA
ncbi:MAG: peptidase [Caulobacteraceae bacterium]|nr:peptidase [Caulobacteraceae bacterium]